MNLKEDLMMTISTTSNFFILQINEPIRNDKLFGLCDDDNNLPAYSDNSEPEKWIAIVSNPSQRLVQFYPIDNVVICLNSANQQESLCDGMLTFDDRLFLVELKERGRKQDWRSKAKKQLINTIKLLTEHNPQELQYYSVFKAYICNKTLPKFEETTIAEKNEFRELSKQLGIRIRLDIQATIHIK